MNNLKTTPLTTSHIAQKARMVPFSGYTMPVQYEGIMAEHNWTRASAGLFDVSHMGQYILEGPGATDLLHKLTPSPYTKMKPLRCKYTVLTNENGGIIDDLIVTRLDEEKYYLVFNAGRKDVDAEWFRQNLPAGCTLTELPDRALVALQGPKAEAAMLQILGESLDDLAYMSRTVRMWEEVDLWISRTGYTGEDGFEISVPNNAAEKLWHMLCAEEEVRPIGLGARDSLRLEAGYPLYGHDLDETTSPIEAGLNWVVRKKNRTFCGHKRIESELVDGPARQRIGIKLVDKGVAREGTEITDTHGTTIGTLTSGGFGPTLEVSIGQGYITSEHAVDGSPVRLKVRNKFLDAVVCSYNFIEPKTKTKTKPEAA